MKNKLISIAVILSSLLAIAANAQTDAEYVAKVGKSLNKNALTNVVAFGQATAVVVVTDDGAKILHKSTSEIYDAEVLRAANLVLDGTVTRNIAFPVTFRGASLVNFNTGI